MKKTLTLGLITAAISITGCTFNVGTPSNTPTANAANTTNSAPTAAENKPANTTNTAVAKKSDSEPSIVKPTSSRIQFGAGETSTNVTKDIPANGIVDFVFNVKKGQTVEYTVGYDFDESDLQIYMGEPGDQDTSIPSSPKVPKTFAVKKSGDHRLEVTNKTKKKVTITLYMDIEEVPPSKANKIMKKMILRSFI